MMWGSFILLCSFASWPFLGWKQKQSPLSQLAFVLKLSAACSTAFVETACALFSLFGIGYILFFLSSQLMVLAGIELFLFLGTMFWICGENRHTDALVIAEQCWHSVKVFSASSTALPVSAGDTQEFERRNSWNRWAQLTKEIFQTLSCHTQQ